MTGRAVKLNRKTNWIFDMDGTLTVAVHDFDAIRRELDLAEGESILEQLAGMSADDSAPREARLHEIEIGLANLAVAGEGAHDLLSHLQNQRANLGILTRNSVEISLRTLEVCGLAGFFGKEDIVGRDTCAPKPDPEGIEILLARWKAARDDTVMVGDYLFDMQCGRSAGVKTILVDADGHGLWSQQADKTVRSLAEILEQIG